MKPILFHLGPLSVKSYGVMLMIGFLSAIWLACRRADKCKADGDVILNMGFIALIMGIVGARIFYVVHYYERAFAPQKHVILAILDVSRGGLEFYGGLLGALGGTLVYLVLTGRSVRWYLDIVAPSLAWGLAWGRVGCLLNGCCWGGICELPWAIRFPYGSLAFRQQWLETNRVSVPKELIITTDRGEADLLPRDLLDMSEKDLNSPGKGSFLSCTDQSSFKALLRAHLEKYDITLPKLRALAAKYRSLPAHPSQVYGVINALLISGVLAAYFWWRRRHGMVTALLLILYPISRFLLEMIRSDNPHDTASLTISQFVSVLMFAGGVLLVIVLHLLPERSPRAVPIDQQR